MELPVGAEGGATAGAVVGAFLVGLRVVDAWLIRRSSNGNGNSTDPKQTVACALDHSKLGATLDRVGEAIKQNERTQVRQTEILEAIGDRVVDAHGVAKVASTNLRALMKDQGVTYMGD